MTITGSEKLVFSISMKQHMVRTPEGEETEEKHIMRHFSLANTNMSPPGGELSTLWPLISKDTVRFWFEMKTVAEVTKLQLQHEVYLPFACQRHIIGRLYSRHRWPTHASDIFVLNVVLDDWAINFLQQSFGPFKNVHIIENTGRNGGLGVFCKEHSNKLRQTEADYIYKRDL